jgi:hypothetical protein
MSFAKQTDANNIVEFTARNSDFDLNMTKRAFETNTIEEENGNDSSNVTICHKPGTPAEKTMTLPASALNGHLGHGDYIGACTGNDNNDNNGNNGNNGHGNNADGVDSSNPGQGNGGPNGQEDPSGGVDDENGNNGNGNSNNGNGNSNNKNKKNK